MIASRFRLEGQPCFGICEVDHQAEWDLARALVISSYQAAGGNYSLPVGEIDHQISKIPIPEPGLSADEKCFLRMSYLHLTPCRTVMWQERPHLLILEAVTYHGKMDPLEMLEDAVARYNRWKTPGQSELGVPLCWTNFQGLTADEVNYEIRTGRTVPVHRNL